MPKIVLMRGLPASGKSTVARELVKFSGNHARVNRDDLRAMLFNSVWTGKREGLVVEIEKAIAKVILRHGYSAIIDDTNLVPKTVLLWDAVHKETGAALQIQKMDAPLETCIARDRSRDKRVGEAVIYRMALNAGLIDFGEKPIVLVDIDGTIADGEHREGHLKGERKDWKTYYSLLGLDDPIDFVVRWVRELAKSHTICLVSGRPDTYQHETLRWLDLHDIPHDYLFMRAGNDKREDYIVKAEILAKIPRHLVQFAIDDRPQVIEKCWRANGVKVYPVRGACEPF